MWQSANFPNAFKVALIPATDRLQPTQRRVASAWIQNAICWALLLPFGGMLVLLLKYFRGYEIENLSAIRGEFKALWSQNNGPLIICANHLTFIDSALIIWALAANFWYWRHYRAFAWNLPAGDVFKKKLRYHLTLYLTKCIFLHRDGSAKHKNAVLNLCRYLLLKGQVVLIFPEGQRSRTGFFEERKLRFGVGKVASSLIACRVLCVYLRGDKQETFSNYPPSGSRFTLKLRVITPTSNETSRKLTSVDIVRQIGTVIKQLENEYFDERA